MGVLDRSTRINLSGATALVCDTNTVEQDVLAAMLGGFGVNKVSRSSRPENLSTEASRKFDLIFVGVTAINPEAMRGISELRKLKDHPSRTSPVLVMSSYTPKTMIEEARQVGATFVIAKPLTSQIVFDRILWLASTTREFIETTTYFGPDRRVRNFGPPLGEAGRRSGDLSAHVGESMEANMSQDAIDDLMKPAKLVL